MSKFFEKKYPFLIVISTIFILSCTTRSVRRIELLSDITSKKDYRKAIESIRRSSKLYGNLNRFLYWIDQGILFHYLKEFDSSLAYLEKAETVIDELYSRSIANEAASILTNDNLRPYRARRYEQILLHQLLAFNYLAKNQFDEALVETRKVQLVFDRFKSKDKGKERYNDDGMSHFMSSIVYDAQGEPDNAVISLYKSVSAYQNGPIKLPDYINDFVYYRLSHDGRDEDIMQLNLKPASKEEDVPGLDNTQSEIILVGYAGKCPILGETLFWGTYVVDGMLICYYRNPNGDTASFVLPAPPIPEVKNKKEDYHGKTKSGTTFHIKFTLPSVVRRPSKTDRFTITTGQLSNKIVKSIELTDTDFLLERDIEDNYQKTIARTALRVVLRTIAAQKIKKEMMTQSAVVNLLMSFGTDALADQLEKADIRLCFLLPKSIHIARLPVVPGYHRIKAAALDKHGAVISTRVWNDFLVEKGQKRFIFYTELQ